MTKPLISGNNQKARPTFAEEHVVWREENWSKAFIWVRWETLCSASNWGKTEPKLCKDVSERWRRKCHGAAEVGPLIQLHGRVNANVYPLQSLNCGRDWKKIGPRSYQSSVRDYSDVLWPQMCWSHSKQLISDCCNLQKLSLSLCYNHCCFSHFDNCVFPQNKGFVLKCLGHFVKHCMV